MSLDRRTAARLDAWLTREPDWAAGRDDLAFDWDQDHCDICGEPLDGEVAEMYKPPFGDAKICHAQCGLDAGMEIA